MQTKSHVRRERIYRGKESDTYNFVKHNTSPIYININVYFSLEDYNKAMKILSNTLLEPRNSYTL